MAKTKPAVNAAKKVSPIVNTPEAQPENPLEIWPGSTEGKKGLAGTVGHKFWVLWNGVGMYKSGEAIRIALIRQKANSGLPGWNNIAIEIPKGSPFVVPEELKGECKGCG